jgi:hypothetical protein
MTLETLIGQIKTKLTTALPYVDGAVGGLRAVYAYAPDQANAFPLAVIYPFSGTWSHDTPETKMGLHTIAIDIHVPRKDLARDMDKLYPFCESIPNAIIVAWVAEELGAMDAFDMITYQFSSFGYGGTDTIGWRFLITEVKMRSDLT